MRGFGSGPVMSRRFWIRQSWGFRLTCPIVTGPESGMDAGPWVMIQIARSLWILSFVPSMVMEAVRCPVVLFRNARGLPVVREMSSPVSGMQSQVPVAYFFHTARSARYVSRVSGFGVLRDSAVWGDGRTAGFQYFFSGFAAIPGSGVTGRVVVPRSAGDAAGWEAEGAAMVRGRDRRV